jgi:hypothetical protein
MRDPKILAQLEVELARNTARLQEIGMLEFQLLQRSPEEGYRAVVRGIRFRCEKEMLANRIYKTRILLVDARR